MSLENKTILITGGARRLGRHFALTAAKAGANIILHHSHSPEEAQKTAVEIEKFSVKCKIISVDFSDPEITQSEFVKFFQDQPIYGLVNNAAIFEPVKFADTTLLQWQQHMNINLTAPFLLSQLFAENIGQKEGRILNIVDWRALRPGRDHFPYTISKAALAEMTKALALNLAPNIQVNALALGAILPPTDGNKDENIIRQVPANRWADLEELSQAFLFLMDGPRYITGEILHLDGGRHLV
jgi:NAD(P)-dependent dehydrogenase (short-subunit alcohol dehydrogenase family)